MGRRSLRAVLHSHRRTARHVGPAGFPAALTGPTRTLSRTGVDSERRIARLACSGLDPRRSSARFASGASGPRATSNMTCKMAVHLH